MERDLRAEGWGPEDCYPGSDAGSNSACIAGLCADFRATRGQLEIAENRIAELIEDKRRIEARAKWAEMMLSDWYAKVLTPEVFDQEIRAWLERIGAIEP